VILLQYCQLTTRHEQYQRFSHNQTHCAHERCWSQVAAGETALPPAVGEFLTRLFLSKRKADDLANSFRSNCELRGYRRAWWLFWAEASFLTRPLVWRVMKRWGLIAILIDAVRRILLHLGL
jgi:hypothetical protein